MKVTQFEGSPEEFKAVAHLFVNPLSPEELSQNGGNSQRLDKKTTIDKKEAIRKMLKRRMVSAGQRAVYKALADGELAYDEFLKKTNRTSSELAGVLGALGRRINQTKEIKQAGLPGNVYAVINYREEDGGGLYLSLMPYAEEVLREEGII